MLERVEGPVQVYPARRIGDVAARANGIGLPQHGCMGASPFVGGQQAGPDVSHDSPGVSEVGADTLLQERLWSQFEYASGRSSLPALLDKRDNAAMSSLTELFDDIVAANRILAGLRVLDGFGHVSARHPEHAERYLLSRSLAPELVTPADIMTFDLASIAQDGDTRTAYLERFIHGAIYARRPDVQAIVHSHSPAVVPFTVSSVPLRPIYHMSSFLHAGAPVFEIRARFGMTDMLIREPAHGAALAEQLADHTVVLMRGHGFCAVGDSLPVAVFRAVYTQANAAMQQKAIALGGAVAYLDDEEARRADETNGRVVGRPWALWRAKYHPGSDH